MNSVVCHMLAASHMLKHCQALDLFICYVFCRLSCHYPFYLLHMLSVCDLQDLAYNC